MSSEIHNSPQVPQNNRTGYQDDRLLTNGGVIEKGQEAAGTYLGKDPKVDYLSGIPNPRRDTDKPIEFPAEASEKPAGPKKLVYNTMHLAYKTLGLPTAPAA